MSMNRRAFTAALAGSVANSLIPAVGVTASPSPPAAGNVVLAERRAAFRRPAGDVDDVFDADRNAVQRALKIVVGSQAVETMGVAARPFGVEKRPGAHVRFVPLDAGQAMFDKIACG